MLSRSQKPITERGHIEQDFETEQGEPDFETEQGEPYVSQEQPDQEPDQESHEQPEIAEIKAEIAEIKEGIIDNSDGGDEEDIDANEAIKYLYDLLAWEGWQRTKQKCGRYLGQFVLAGDCADILVDLFVGHDNEGDTYIYGEYRSQRAKRLRASLFPCMRISQTTKGAFTNHFVSYILDLSMQTLENDMGGWYSRIEKDSDLHERIRFAKRLHAREGRLYFSGSHFNDLCLPRTEEEKQAVWEERKREIAAAERGELYDRNAKG